MTRNMYKVAALATFATLATFASGTASAEEAAPAASPFAFNIGVVSDYRFRGISQSRRDPAIQGGIDFASESTGLYAGVWASSIMWTKDAGGSGSVETDIYGGKKGTLPGNITYDLGLLAYIYPSNDLHPNANTVEAYGQLGYGPAYIKYSSSLTNLFGYANSKNSGYLDIGANIDMPYKLVLNLHAGHQTIVHNSQYSYNDWKIGLTRDFGFVTGSIAYIGTSTSAYRGPSYDNKNLGKNTLLLSVLKTF